MPKDLRQSIDDITGNRANHPSLSTRYSSDPSRNAALDQVSGESTGNMFGSSSMYAFAYSEDYFIPEMEDATFFNSRMDLDYELPSTNGQRWSAQNQK